MKKLFLIILVVSAAVVIYYNLPANRENIQNFQEQNTPTNQDQTRGPEEGAQNTWEGRLENSDNQNLGNLKLNFSDSADFVYIRTSRDFSSLVGKDVKVTFDGDRDSFVLIDIQSK